MLPKVVMETIQKYYPCRENNSSGYLNNRYVSAGVKYGNATNATYGNALQDVTVAEELQMLDKAVAVLATNGATRSDLGMEMAQKVFANNPIEDGERNRVVVMFTDGVPTTSSVLATLLQVVRLKPVMS